MIEGRSRLCWQRASSTIVLGPTTLVALMGTAMAFGCNKAPATASTSSTTPPTATVGSSSATVASPTPSAARSSPAESSAEPPEARATALEKLWAGEAAKRIALATTEPTFLLRGRHHVALVGRTEVAFCLRPSPKRPRYVLPPDDNGPGKLRTYRNPPDVQPLRAADFGKPCAFAPRTYLDLEVAPFGKARDLVIDLRGDRKTQSIVLTGHQCQERDDVTTERPPVLVCRRVSFVYDVVNGVFTPPETAPERPEQGRDLDGDGRLEFPRTAFYFSTVDPQKLDTAFELAAYTADVPGFEAWDGRAFSMEAPKLAVAYKKAYQKDVEIVADFGEQIKTGADITCSAAQISSFAASALVNMMFDPLLDHQHPDPASKARTAGFNPMETMPDAFSCLRGLRPGLTPHAFIARYQEAVRQTLILTPIAER
jgi:hypothetical protein